MLFSIYYTIGWGKVSTGAFCCQSKFYKTTVSFFKTIQKTFILKARCLKDKGQRVQILILLIRQFDLDILSELVLFFWEVGLRKVDGWRMLWN